MKRIYWLSLSLLLFAFGCSKDEDVVPAFLPDIEIRGAATVEEGSSVILSLSLDSISEQSVSIDYIIESGTAVQADVQGYGENKTITFLPGEKNKTMTIQILSDSEEEDDEAFMIKFSNAKNGKLSTQELTITIKNKSTDTGGETATYYMEVMLGTNSWKSLIGGFFGASMMKSVNSIGGYGSGANFDSKLTFLADEMYAVGTYNIKKYSAPGEVGLAFSPTFFSSNMMGIVYWGFEGELIIESVDLDNNVASGTFSGKVKDDDGNIIELTNGKFFVPIE